MDQPELQSRLFSYQDNQYRDFMSKLIPTVERERVIGIRTPQLREFVKELYASDDYRWFLEATPHAYFEEDQLHAFVISLMKDFDQCLSETDRFLPYINNWATCDQLSPKVFRRNHDKLLPTIRNWIASELEYVCRFGVGMLMEHFLEKDFDPCYPALVAEIRSESYYVNMMIAWYFATALAKQYPFVITYLEDRKLPEWVHRKTIQKAVESYRITPEQKKYLKGLRNYT